MVEQKAGSVLIVDDDSGMRVSLEALLEERFTVMAAESVTVAQRTLELFRVDVLLSDYELQDGTGLELFRWANQRYPQMMAIVITGQPDHPALVEAKGSESIVRVLEKPFDPARLVGLVERTVQLVRLRETMQSLARKRASPSGRLP